MDSLIDIQSQIEKLQARASAIRTKEFHSTVMDILAKMQAFGISMKDLQTASAKGGKARTASNSKRVSSKAKKPPSKPVPAKYRGPNGESWSGRGLSPRWLAALLVDGKQKEDFAIKR